MTANIGGLDVRSRLDARWALATATYHSTVLYVTGWVRLKGQPCHAVQIYSVPQAFTRVGRAEVWHGKGSLSPALDCILYSFSLRSRGLSAGSWRRFHDQHSSI